MGKSEIRYAAKVDLEKDAASQPQLHVSLYTQYTPIQYLLILLAEPLAPRQYLSLPSSYHPPTNSYLTVPSAGKIADGEVVKIECVDWTGGQIKNTDDADDIKNVDLTKIHYLSGPFEIENAEPGDVLVVEIQDVQPLQEQPWGFTGIFAKENGGGFLDELYPDA
jgi:formamidase